MVGEDVVDGRVVGNHPTTVASVEPFGQPRTAIRQTVVLPARDVPRVVQPATMVSDRSMDRPGGGWPGVLRSGKRSPVG